MKLRKCKYERHGEGPWKEAEGFFLQNKVSSLLVIVFTYFASPIQTTLKLGTLHVEFIHLINSIAFLAR